MLDRSGEGKVGSKGMTNEEWIVIVIIAVLVVPTRLFRWFFGYRGPHCLARLNNLGILHEKPRGMQRTFSCSACKEQFVQRL